MKKWIPIIGWQDIGPDEALMLGLDQPGRFQWEAFGFEWLGFGIWLWVRPKGALL